MSIYTWVDISPLLYYRFDKSHDSCAGKSIAYIAFLSTLVTWLFFQVYVLLGQVLHRVGEGDTYSFRFQCGIAVDPSESTVSSLDRRL